LHWPQDSIGLSSSALLIGYSKRQVPHVYRIAGPPQVAEQGLPGSLRHSVALSLQTSSLGCIMPSTRGEAGGAQSLQPGLFGSTQCF
jgi:hypothetical protein